MDTVTNIKLMKRNTETGGTEPSGDTITTYALARSITPNNFTKLFEDYLNLGGKGFPEGKRIGLNLRITHRTLQRLAVCFAIGIIIGLSEQEFWDARNDVAIMTAKKLAKMMEEGDLPLGLYI